MKDIEVMVVFPPCHLSPEERIIAKEMYDKADCTEKIPIGNQMLYASYVMTEGNNRELIGSIVCFLNFSILSKSLIN